MEPGLENLSRTLEELRLRRNQIVTTKKNDSEKESLKMQLRIAENQNVELENLLVKMKQDRVNLITQVNELQEALRLEKERTAQVLIDAKFLEDSLVKTQELEIKKLIKINEQSKLENENLNRVIVEKNKLLEEILQKRRRDGIELKKLKDERNHAVLQAKRMEEKIAQFEQIFPEINEKNFKLTLEIQRLKEDLEETLESEEGLRALLLQDQSLVRRRRRMSNNMISSSTI